MIKDKRAPEASCSFLSAPPSQAPPLVPFSPFSEPLPIFSSEPIRTCPFKMKSSADQKAKLLISYVLWTKTELQAIVEVFPNVTEDLYKFVEEFSTVVQTHQPGFSDLHQLAYMFVA